jgi:hypothetical protein
MHDVYIVLSAHVLKGCIAFILMPTLVTILYAYDTPHNSETRKDYTLLPFPTICLFINSRCEQNNIKRQLL